MVRESDEDEYDVVGCVDGIERETEKAVLLKVHGGVAMWFPRFRLRLEDDDIILCESQFYKEKMREYR